MAQPEWPALLGGYSQRMHAAVGDIHHTVSPLGAWMILALCGDLGEPDVVAENLGGHLGADPSVAAAFARSLLADPHPLVAAGAGVWVPAGIDMSGLGEWRARLPEQVDTGEIPSQADLDRWVAKRTLGLVERFPLAGGPDVVCLLASALATRVSWEVPFQVVDAAELGPSRWAGAITRVLRTPPDPRHRQFLAETGEAGPVAVHLAQARGGLLVGSVIADPNVEAGAVLAAAERIVTGEASAPGSVRRLSLFDLPLGPGPAWEIVEEPHTRAGPFDSEQRHTSVLPAWSAGTNIDLTASSGLGFGGAAEVLARALGVSPGRFGARQAAVARYSAVGFEAAAVTGLALAAAARTPRHTPRRAIARFGHAYAVAAATYDPAQTLGSPPSPWHALPVFSAWVATPEDADPPESGGEETSVRRAVQA